MRARDNPFRIDRVLSLPYRLPCESWDEILERLTALHFRAAIVGPHGSGKTTLLDHLRPHLEQRGFHLVSLRLSEDRRTFDAGLPERLERELDSRQFVILDGAEQLNWFAWRRFVRRTRHAAGLLITTHRSGRLPTLLHCDSSPQLLSDLVAELLGPAGPELPWPIETLFQRHRGNLREAMLELFDWFAGQSA